MNKIIDFVSVKIIKEDTKCWFVRSEGGKLYNEYSQNQYISLGWNYLTKEKLLNINNTEKELRRVLKDEYHEKQLTKVINKCKMFALDMKKGDYVIIPNGGSTLYTIGKLDTYFEGDKNELFNIQGKDERILLVNDITKRSVSEELSDVRDLMEGNEEDIQDSPYLKRWTFNVIATLPWKSIHPTLFISLRSPNSIMSLEENKDLFFASIYPIFHLDNNLHFNFNVLKSGDINASDINDFTYNITKLFESELDLSDHAFVQKISVSSSGPVMYTLANIASNTELWTNAALLFGCLVIAIGGGKISGKSKNGEMGFETPGILDGISRFRKDSINVEREKFTLEKEKYEFEKQKRLDKALSVISEEGLKVVPDSSSAYIKTIKNKAKILEIDTKRNKDVVIIENSIGSDNNEGNSEV